MQSTSYSNLKKFLYFNDMNRYDFSLQFISLFTPVLYFINFNKKITFITVMLLFWYFYILALKKQFSNKKNIQYQLIILSLVLSNILLQVFIMIKWKNETEGFLFSVLMITFAISLLLYSVGLLLSIKMLITYIYYVFLKLMFPKESTRIVNLKSIRTLSQHLNINDQKAYINTIAINLIVYFSGVIYLFIWFFKNYKYKGEDTFIKVLIEYCQKIEFANFGNSIGILSITIAVYTLTYSTLNKIYEKAHALSENKTKDLEV